MSHASILFGKEALDLDPGSFSRSSFEELRSPTVYTGQRVRGTVRIYHDKRLGPLFDTVQLMLKGMSHFLTLPECLLTLKLSGQVSNVITLGGTSWKVEKPVSPLK